MITDIGIQCFLDLTKTLSFTRTSENLYMTQQSVSKHIVTLEESLGFPLLVRTHRTVQLTQEGEKFAALFSRFEVEFSRCLSEAAKSHRLREKHLRFGYQSWTNYHAATAQATLEAQQFMPSLVLEGELHSPITLLKMLDSGEQDLIMLFSRFIPDTTRFCRLKLKSIPLVLLVPKHLAETHAQPRVSDFASYPLLVNKKEQEIMKYSVHCEELRRFGLTPSEIIVLQNQDSVFLSVELGNGVALESSICLSDDRAITKLPTGIEDDLFCLWRNDETAGLGGMYAQLLKSAFDAPQLLSL